MKNIQYEIKVSLKIWKTNNYTWKTLDYVVTYNSIVIYKNKLIGNTKLRKQIKFMYK